MIKTTKQQKNYWKKRKIDWKEAYQSTVDHPHRLMLSSIIRNLPFTSLWEVGVGGGANIIRFIKDIQGKQFGGCDVSEDAIELCKKTFTGGVFHVESGDNMMMSDKSVDIILSDMCLIYVDPRHIDKYLKEFRRVARNYVVLCEFHSRSFWKRLKARFTSGYHVYDYRKRLEKQGYRDISTYHISEEFWPADNNSEFRTIIIARP